MAVKDVTAETFEDEALKSELPVFADFWAEWCGPCHMVSPIIEELSKEYDGRVRFVKVDVDQNPDLAARYGVMGIPTLIVFNDGREVSRVVGAANKSHYVKQIQSVLKR